MFFPADARELAAEVAKFLRAARAQDLNGAAKPRAIISAHAGYPYSGRFAGLSFGTVGWTPARVVVVSPSHRHGFQGIAFPSQEFYQTPLGPIRIDRVACGALQAAGLAHSEDAAHDNEHGIETQLPFIQALWPEAQVVPLVCGDVAPGVVASALDALDAPDTLVVLSSDLSHFLTHKQAGEKDSETARLIETGEARELTPYHACGAKGIQGWLTSRSGQGTKALRLGMGDSSEVTGDSSRVVGYGAWAFYPIDAAMLHEKSQAELLARARGALAGQLGNAPAEGANPAGANGPLQTHAASFVTLTQRGALRGCIGTISAQRALAADVARNAIGAGFRDPRFLPVTADVLPRLRVKIAVLSRTQPLEADDESAALDRIAPGLDGLVLAAGAHRGTFLPMVWESLPDPRDFLRALKRKAGLPVDFWSEDLTLRRFRVESFAEPEFDG